MYSQEKLNTYRTLSPKLLKKKEINLNDLNKEIIKKRNHNNNKAKIYYIYNSYYKTPNTSLNNTYFKTIVKQLPSKLYLTRNSNQTFKSKEIILCNLTNNYSKSLENFKSNKYNEYIKKNINHKFKLNHNKNLSSDFNKRVFSGDSLFPKEKTFSSNNLKKSQPINNQIFNPAKIILNKLYERKLVSDNFYSILSKKQLEYFNKISNPVKKECDKELQIKKQFFNSPSNSMSYILNKSKENDIPIVYPNFVSFCKSYNSESEKDRYEKNKSLIIKLQYFFNNYWHKRNEISKDFFNQNNIFDEKYYNNQNFENFSNFIKHNFNNIDCKKTIKEIIDEGIKFEYKEDEKNKENQNKEIKEKYGYRNSMYLEKDKKVIESFRKHLDKMYNDNTNQNLLYFKHKYGKIDTFKGKSLANCLTKQKLLYKKYNNKTLSPFQKNSVDEYDENDVKELEKELNSLNEIKLNDNDINDQRNKRLYYTFNLKKMRKNPEELIRKKKKLLEYIVLQNVKNKQAFLQDINKSQEE
jgi:hypothetical protein